MYGKFFSSTFTGSMFGVGSDVFAVWGYVIANTIDSTVELNHNLLAAVLGSTPEKMEEAIQFLCNPDPKSRNPDEDGRRLISVGQFQYRVVSHEIYRAIRNEEDRRAYNRQKQAEHRAKKKAAANTNVNSPVNDSQTKSTLSAQAEAEAYSLSSENQAFPERPSVQEEDVSAIIIEAVLHHPRARLVSMTEMDVRPKDTSATLDAVEAEAQRSPITRIQAAEMIRDRTRAICEGVPRDQWKFIKPIDEFMRDRQYRLEPGDLARGGKNGSDSQNKTAQVSPAIQRQRESDEGLRNIARRRYGVSFVDEAGEGSVHQPATPRSDGGNVSGGVGRDGDAVRADDVPGRVIEGHP